MPYRILVVDDSIFFRRLVRARLDAEPGMVVVGEARDGKEAVTLAERLRPDVIVIDGAMPLMDGVEALPLIRDVLPECRIVFMDAHDDVLERALAEGADAAVNKSDSVSVCVSEVSIVLDDVALQGSSR